MVENSNDLLALKPQDDPVEYIYRTNVLFTDEI